MLHVSIYTTVRQEYMFLLKYFYKIFCAEWISFNLLGIWFRGLFVYLRAHVLMNPIRSVQMVCFSYLTFRVYVFAEQKKKRRKRWFLTPSLWAHILHSLSLSPSVSLRRTIKSPSVRAHVHSLPYKDVSPPYFKIFSLAET